MKYIAPYGSNDPDAPYLDRNSPGATRGSTPPGAAIEDPQREIVNVITRAGMTPDEAQLQLWDAIKRVAGLIVKRTIVTASGTFTVNALTVFADVEICGGGGGGGGAYGQPAPTVSAASGGGGGGYTRKLYTKAEIGVTATVVIGAGGSAGAAGQNNGGAGGASSFVPAGTGPGLAATGGLGGGYGQTFAYPTRGNVLGAFGSGSGGDINISGGASGWPLMWGGATAYSAISGRGGNSVFGFGGQESQEDFTGNPAQGYGTGGGGGAALTVSRAGGAGKAGVCIVTEYIKAA